jgi:hypothetical protein
MEKCSTIQRLRKPKLLDMSIFDWVTSLLGAFLIGKLFGVSNWLLFIFGWIAFGIFAHLIFGINTMFGYYLGINEKPVRKDCL